MIRKVRINNYKSIPDLTLDLGRVTVLIGANGSGKSNILEAIALASAAAQNKLDNEFLISRGIRVTETRFMALGVPASCPRRLKPFRFRSRKTNEPTFDEVRMSGKSIRVDFPHRRYDKEPLPGELPLSHRFLAP